MSAVDGSRMRSTKTKRVEPRQDRTASIQRLDEQLCRAMKIRAIEKGMTLNKLVEEVLRAYLERSQYAQFS